MGVAESIRQSATDEGPIHRVADGGNAQWHAERRAMADEQGILPRLPTQPNSRIGELLPHRWRPESAA